MLQLRGFVLWALLAAAMTQQLATPECGNGVLEEMEACDDNNTVGMDGCSENCTVEENFTCSQDPNTNVSVCSAILLDLNTADNTTLGYTAEFEARVVYFLSNPNETLVTFIGGNWTFVTLLILEAESTISEEVNIFTDPQLLEGRLTEDEIIAFRNRFIPLAVLPVFDFPFGFEGSTVVSGVQISSMRGMGSPFTPEEINILLLQIGYIANENEPGFDTRRVCVVAENTVYQTSVCVELFFIGFNDDAPSVEYLMAGVARFVEQQAEPVLVVNGTITVSDPDHPTRYPIEGAVASIVGFVSGEVLSVTYELPGFTYSFDNASGVLNITGSAPAAEYGVILANITYFNDMSEPVADRRSIEIQVFDGMEFSDERTSTIDVIIVNINDRPAVSLDGAAPIVRSLSANFMERAAPVILAPSLVVVDPDPTAMIVRVSVRLANPIDGAQERLAIAGDTMGLSVAGNDYFVNLTGMATAAVYNVVLRTLTYVHLDANPGNPTTDIVRRIEFQAEDDQGALSDFSVVMLTIIPVNDPPILLYVSNDTLRASTELLTDGVMAASFNYTEDDPPINFGRDIYLRDIDSSMLATATVNLTGLLNGAQDSITFDAVLLTSSGVNVSESTSNGGESRDVLLEGQATLEQYEAILRSMAYSNLLRNDSVQNGQRNVTIVAQDLEGEVSDLIVAYITVMNRNDMPAIDLGGGENMDFTITYIENEPSIAVAVFHLTNLMDEEDNGISSLSIMLLSTNGMLDAGEAIFLRTPTALEIFFDPRNTFTDTFIYVEMNGTTVDYLEILQSLRYVNTEAEPTLTNAQGENLTREVVIRITDANFGDRSTAEIRVGIEIQPVNDNAPRIYINSLPASCTEDFRDQDIVVTRSRREVRSASKQQRKRQAYDSTDGDNSNAPRLTDVHASLSPGSCLQNVTLVFKADTSAPVVEIQHDLRFLLHFDPPELNWVAHRGLWLDFRTLVVVFDECVVWEGATSSGRERPMFVAFEALRGSCNETTPCHVGVCFSNLTGCPLTGYHQILTNKSHDLLADPPVAPSDVHMYYHSCVVTLIVVSLALVVMVWTARIRMTQRSSPPQSSVFTKTVDWSASSELPPKSLKPVTTLTAQTVAIDISPSKAPDHQVTISPSGSKVPLEELSSEYKPTEEALTLATPPKPQTPPLTPPPSVSPSKPNKTSSRVNQKAASPRVKKTTPSGKDPPLLRYTPDEIGALEATATVSLVGITNSSIHPGRNEPSLARLQGQGRPHLPARKVERDASQTEQRARPESCSHSSQASEKLGTNRQPRSQDVVARGNHPVVSREHLLSYSANNSTDRHTLNYKVTSEH